MTRHTVAARTRKLSANWTIDYSHSLDIIDKPYELTAEEKEGLSPEEQETWRVLKTTEKFDIHEEITSILSAAIAKEIDNELLYGILSSGTTTK